LRAQYDDIPAGGINADDALRGRLSINEAQSRIDPMGY
jgi:hypothetical protein